MFLWSEAKEEYETAAALAKLALSNDNPIHTKIMKALLKVRMQVRNKVQKFPEQKPFLARVNSGDTEDPQKPNIKLWAPKFKRPSVVKEINVPLTLKDLVNKLDHKYLSVREPKHCHNLSANPAKLGPRNINGEQTARDYSNTLGSLMGSMLPPPTLNYEIDSIMPSVMD